MVRFINAKIKIYAETTTIDDSGDSIAEFTLVETVEGDVQPHAMTQDEMKAYGISASRGNVRLFLYNGYHQNIKLGNRASVESDFTGSEEMFSIMPINAWSRHGECLLIPVENESEDGDNTEGTVEADTGSTGEDGTEETVSG
jgi:hypothetical protein